MPQKPTHILMRPFHNTSLDNASCSQYSRACDIFSVNSCSSSLFVGVPPLLHLFSKGRDLENCKKGEKNGPMAISHTWDRIFIHQLADQAQGFCDFHWEVVSILQILHQHLLFDQLCLSLLLRLLFGRNFFDRKTPVVTWRILMVLTWA